MTHADADARTIETLERLVAFNTVSDRSNLELIAFAEERLAAAGARMARAPSADGSKTGLIASFGPDVAGGVVLSGHVDVVPVTGQPWSSDPFRLTRRGERLYGRGAADMKGFVAIALALAPDMAAAALKRPIHIVMTYDEEVGCLAAPEIIEVMQGVVPPPAAAIIGEPTEMAVVTGNKGILKLDVAVRGHEVHSSRMFDGASAVMAGARLVTWCDDVSRANRAAADPSSPFDPPFSTVHCGVFSGGSAANITALDARFTVDIRALPTEDPHSYRRRLAVEAEALAEEMRRAAPGCGVSISVLSDVPGLAPEIDGAAEALCRRVTGDNGVHTASYAAEAGQYQAAGLSAVLCGPGSIAQAHQPDEFIELAQLRAGVAFQQRLIAELARA